MGPSEAEHDCEEVALRGKSTPTRPPGEEFTGKDFNCARARKRRKSSQLEGRGGLIRGQMENPSQPGNAVESSGAMVDIRNQIEASSLLVMTANRRSIPRAEREAA
jgi:hypothetical protein